jgi:Ice-binding-like
MTTKNADSPPFRTAYVWIAAMLTGALALFALVLTPTAAQAIATEVPLGTLQSVAVLGGQSVTNTGPSVVNGDLGVSPGTSVTGFFPPGVVNGTIHVADAVAAQNQNDLTTAYNNAAGQAADASIPADLGGLTLVPGVYNAPSSTGLTGTLTLNAQGNPDAVWIFQVGSTLTTASASTVALINGASPCNVFWQIGSSATLGTGTNFTGTILAQTSITATTGATIAGRALARTGSVTLDTNTITRPQCATTTTGTTTATTGATTATTGATTATTGATTATTGATTATTTGGLLSGGLLTGGSGGLLSGGLLSGGLLGGITTGGLVTGGTNTIGGVTTTTNSGGTTTTTGGSTTGGTATGATTTGGTVGGTIGGNVGGETVGGENGGGQTIGGENGGECCRPPAIPCQPCHHQGPKPAPKPQPKPQPKPCACPKPPKPAPKPCGPCHQWSDSTSGADGGKWSGHGGASGGDEGAPGNGS